jgi:hypothetical protein
MNGTRHRRLNRAFILAICVVATPSLFGRTRAQAQNAEITNVTIIELVSAGVPPDTIALIVRASSAAFDTSEAGLAALRQRGTPEAVIDAMRHRSSRQLGAAAPDAVPTAIAFALERQDAGGTSLVYIAEAPHTSAMSYGLFSAGMKLIVPGKNARAEADEGQPRFRVELPSGRKPTDFILSKFEESDEGGARQINPESSLMFDVERVAEGVYRLTPREPLRRGEYGFYLADSRGPSAIFDFRVIRR